MEISFAWSDAFLPKAVKMWKGRDASVIILYKEESGRKSFISFFCCSSNHTLSFVRVLEVNIFNIR